MKRPTKPRTTKQTPATTTIRTIDAKDLKAVAGGRIRHETDPTI